MNEEKVGLILRVMLNRYLAGQTNAVQVLPKDLQETVTSQTLESDDINCLLSHPINILSKIHYSWLIPKFKDLSKREQILFLATIPESLSSTLSNVLQLDIPSITVSNTMKQFILYQCMQNIKFDDILPLEYLPTTEMKEVAQLDKKDLLKLIDFLGLYDLAEEIHHIVDKKILEKIYKCITEKQHAFLRDCMHRKEKLISQALKLEVWDGDCQKLTRLLHHRGIVRLGYALSGEKKEIAWYTTHVLDTGRGEKLSRYIHKEGIAGVTPTLKKHVKKVLNFIKKS